MNPDDFAREALGRAGMPWSRRRTVQAVTAASSALAGAFLAVSHQGVNGSTLLAAILFGVAVTQLLLLVEAS